MCQWSHNASFLVHYPFCTLIFDWNGMYPFSSHWSPALFSAWTEPPTVSNLQQLCLFPIFSSKYNWNILQWRGRGRSTSDLHTTRVGSSPGTVAYGRNMERDNLPLPVRDDGKKNHTIIKSPLSLGVLGTNRSPESVYLCALLVAFSEASGLAFSEKGCWTRQVFGPIF